MCGGEIVFAYIRTYYFLILIFFSTAISTYIKHLSKNLSLHTQGHTCQMSNWCYIYHGISYELVYFIIYKKIKINTFELVMMDSHQYLHPSLLSVWTPAGIWSCMFLKTRAPYYIKQISITYNHVHNNDQIDVESYK